MKKTSLFFLLVLCVVSGFSQRRRDDAQANQAQAAGQPAPAGKSVFYVDQKSYDSFMPIDPVIFIGRLPVWGKDTVREENVMRLAADQPRLKRMLPDFSANFYLWQYTQSGDRRIGLSGVTGDPGSYQVVYDIVKFTTVSTGKPDEACKEISKVGVGIRVRASISTTKPNIDVSSLLYLDDAARRGDILGGLSFEYFGVSGKDIINLAPGSNASIDDSSISVFFQHISAVKSRIFDNDVTIIPRVFAVQRIGCDTKAQAGTVTGQN